MFSWSYAGLSPAAAGVFRLLGLHLGPDVSTAAAVSLTGLPAADLRSLLEELAAAQLVTEPAPDRWVLHDLVRAYAAELAQADPAGATAAAGRLLDHYLHSAEAGARLLRDSRDPLPLGPPRPGVVPERPADHTAALEWAAVQRPALLAALSRSRDDRYGWRLALAIEPYLSLRRSSREVAPVLAAGLAAAERGAGAAAGAGRPGHRGPPGAAPGAVLGAARGLPGVAAAQRAGDRALPGRPRPVRAGARVEHGRLEPGAAG